MVDVHDLNDVTIEWAIDLARKGDRGPLVHFLKTDSPISEVLRLFLADVLDGKIRLKRRRKLTVDVRWERYARERWVVRHVKAMMSERGRKRDKALRTELTRKLCERVGTTPAAVERYLNLSKKRRA